jgi:protocatechuate 3,4-dioxygenase beta subunit
MAKTAFLLIIAILSMARSLPTVAQQTAAGREQKPPASRSNQGRANKDARADSERSIKGRVTDDGGQPIEDASVFLLPAGISSAQGMFEAMKVRPTSTDDEGKFDLDSVNPGAYSLMSFAPGYVTVAGSSIDGGVQRYYRPGEFVSVRLVKGGVITGTVTNEGGEPMVAARVKVIRVRDAEGRPSRVRLANPTQLFEDWKTDDRGHYRIYGLEPGSYVVSTGGKGLFSFQEDGYAGDVSTYYPSSTRDTATEVKVSGGQETIGIDIRYRGGRGYAISGTIAGGASTSMSTATIITLTHAASGATEAMTFIPMAIPNRGFAFYGMADGEYFVSAICPEEKTSASVAPPRRVKVKGGDVTGIELVLAPVGSIAGRVVVEALDREQKPECKPARKTTMEEIVLLARRDAKDGKPQAFSPFEFLPFSMDSVPDDKGGFTIANLEASRYHVDTRLPDETLYVRSLTLQSNTSDEKNASDQKNSSDQKAASNKKAGGPQNGIRLKQGERLTGLTITITEGASGLAGKITAANKEQPLPARLRAHLIPAEPEATDDFVRYREAIAEGDGSFAFTNVAPGRYRILAREIADAEMGEDGPSPIAWAEQGREMLRREAESSATIVELQSCQRVKDYALRFTPAAKQPAK